MEERLWSVRPLHQGKEWQSLLRNSAGARATRVLLRRCFVGMFLLFLRWGEWVVAHKARAVSKLPQLLIRTCQVLQADDAGAFYVGQRPQ